MAARITGTVVNDKFMLIGLKLEGRRSDILGGSDKTQCVVHMSLDDLKARKIKTAQMSFAGDIPVCLGSFRLNSVPMEIYMGGEYRKFNSEIEVVGRITENGKDVGYAVKASVGDAVALSIDAINAISMWMKPKNFVVRHREEDDKPYIAAKVGSISQLPVLANLANKAAAGSDKRKVQKVDTSNLSFEGILDMIASMNGFFAYIPGFIYNAYSKMSAADKAAEESIYAGQLAEPKMLYSLSSANVNLQFRGITKARVERSNGGNPIDLYPQLYREKSVYRNGKLALNTVGVVVEAKHYETVMNSLAAIKPFIIDDKSIVEYFARILAKTPGQIRVIGVSLTGVKPFSGVNNIDYTKLATVVNQYEQIADALKACNKIKTAALKGDNNKFREVHPSLASFSESDLADIALAGIDIKHFTLTRKPKEEDNIAPTGEKAAPSEKTMKLDWQIALSEVAEKKKASDIADLVNEATGYAESGNIDALIEFVKNMDMAADKFKKDIWEANKRVVSAGDKKLLLTADVNGIKMTDATSARMKTSKAAVAAVKAPGIEGLRLVASNAADYTLVL